MGHWQLPPNLHSQIEGGPICPFADHSLGSRDGRIPRYTDSHACVRCVSSLTEGLLSLDVHRIHKSFRRRFLEFWSFVDIDDPEECWEWRGLIHSRHGTSYFSFPRFWTSNQQWSAPRVAAWLTWGDIGRLPVKTVCGNPNCCNPLHIRVRGVPHYFHNRHIQAIDLEFNSHKLINETQSFLLTTRDRDPKRFEKLEKSNKLWIESRLNSDGPVDVRALAKQDGAE